MKENVKAKRITDKDHTPVYLVSKDTLPTSEATANLPVDAQTHQPLAPMAQPGYYPGFSTLSQQAFWDEATRETVLKRVQHVPPIRFFSEDEAKLMEAICNRLIPQDDRDEEHKIPIVGFIDERLYENRLDGYRFEDMPPDQDAYHMALQAIDIMAQHMHHKRFRELGSKEQDSVLQTIQEDRIQAAQDIWKKMSVKHFWTLMMGDVVTVYYAHPYAWDEIGYGGPAYPRGYMRLENGKPEPWERHEYRYDWKAPANALSDEYESFDNPAEQGQITGQGGTH